MIGRKKILTILVILSSSLCLLLAGAKIKLADDGFPTGQDSPEGAATDLARAFLTGDAEWFQRVCVRPYAGGHGGTEYSEYLKGVTEHLREDKEKSTPDNPKKITKVYTARHLSKDGPASYGSASFGFRDLMFVDVEVQLRNGSSLVRRTLVIEDRDGKWYAHPVPDVSPLLSDGLWNESASTKPFGNQ